jgi:ABC-2 type transport system ATP-binding protein
MMITPGDGRILDGQRGIGDGRAAIVVEALSKRFGDVDAVRGVTFAVQQGETFGFLGPNGAGKSTTINMLCTLARPSGGHASVAGFDIVRQATEVRRHIGLVFQDTTLDDYLTAEENLRFHGELYGVASSTLAVRIEEMLKMVELWDRRKHTVRTFSGGMKRRLEIARGLLHLPRVLFLDEPTLGLDPQTRSHIWSYIEELRRREGTTIFMTTHYMDEAEYCDRIAIIEDGQIVADGTPSDLKASVGRDRVDLHTQDDAGAIAVLREHFGIEAKMSEGMVSLYVTGGEEFVPRLFAELGVPIRSVRIARPTLDDVFMSYTGRTIRDAEASSGEQRRGLPMIRAHRGR